MPKKELEVKLTLKDEITKKITSVSGKLKFQMRNAAKAMRKHWKGIAVGIAAAAFALKKFGDVIKRVFTDTIAVSAKFEKWQIQLEAFTKSTELAKKKLKELIDFSIKTPFTPEEVLDVSALLLPLEVAGHKLNDLLKMAGNIAATYPMTFKDAALNLNKALSAGMGSARLFYEQGVRSHMQTISGIKDMTKVSQEELAKVFSDIYLDPSSPLSRGIAKLSKTYKGLMSTLEGEWFNFKKDVGESIFETVKLDLRAVLKLIRESHEEGGKYKEVVEQLNTAFKNGYETAKDFMTFFIVSAGQAVDAWNEVVLAIQGARAAGWMLWKEHLENSMKWTKTPIFGKFFIDKEKTREALGETKKILEELTGAITNMKNKASVDFSTKIAEGIKEFKSSLESLQLEIRKTDENYNKATESIEKNIKKVATGTKEKFDAVTEFSKQAARNMQDAFANFFFKAFTGELENLKDVFSEFGKAILQTLAQILAKWVLVNTLGKMSMFAGVFHQGGAVRKHLGGMIKAHQGLAPVRAHNGLATDEVPIIAQTGEGILSRRGMSSLGALNLNRMNRGDSVGGGEVHHHYYINAVDASSFFELVRRNPEAIQYVVQRSKRLNMPGFRSGE